MSLIKVQRLQIQVFTLITMLKTMLVENFHMPYKWICCQGEDFTYLFIFRKSYFTVCMYRGGKKQAFLTPPFLLSNSRWLADVTKRSDHVGPWDHVIIFRRCVALPDPPV